MTKLKQHNYTILDQYTEQANTEGVDNFIKREVQAFKKYENLYADKLSRRDIFIYWLQAHQQRSLAEIQKMYGKSARSWAYYAKKSGERKVKGGAQS